MWGRVGARWRGQKLWVRWSLAVFLIGFLEGTGAHCIDLFRGGIHVYASFGSVPLQVFFVSLVVLDPLIVVLVALVRPAGIRLACGVMVLDLTANWIVSWVQLREDPTWLLQPVGLLPMTLFGLFVIASSEYLVREIKATTTCLHELPTDAEVREAT